MLNSPWQRRAERAQQLCRLRSCAAEILRFYEAVLGFQARLHERVATAFGCDAMRDPDASLPQYGDLPLLIAEFEPFLELVRKTGPPQAASVAANLTSNGDAWPSLLESAWQTKTAAPADHPQRFLALAFLQPYAEWVRDHTTPSTSITNSFLCPTCRRKPGFGVIRPLGEGGKRFLVCSFCLQEWEFRRIVCAACGEEDHRQLPVYLPEGDFSYIRVECCDRCNQYLKAIDLTRNGLAEPVVDEIAAAPLDLWARERGYSKIAINLMGI